MSVAGCGVVLGLFALMLLRIWRIAHLSKDMLGTWFGPEVRSRMGGTGKGRHWCFSH